MEISAIEISLLTTRIATQVTDYFLSGVYSMDDGALFRFNHSTKPEKLVAVSSFAPWLTGKNLSISQATKFVSRLRNLIERYEITSFEQIGNERISRFSFENRKGEKRNLFTEFFSRGNLILTDPSCDDLILDVSSPQSFRHRTLAQGEKYVLPPSRGVALQEIDDARLAKIFQESVASKEDQSISIIKWFGRNVGTSRKFVEEIFFRSKVSPNLSLKSLNQQEISELAKACLELGLDLEKSVEGYVLIPAEDSDLEPDVCPIIPHSWNLFKESKLASLQNYPSLSEALDEVQIQSLVLKKRRNASVVARKKAEELMSALAKQQIQMERNREISKDLRLTASQLMTDTTGTIPMLIIQNLISYDILKIPQESPTQPRFVTEPKAFLKSYTPTSLASRLFDEAKRLEEANSKLAEVMRDLEEQKNGLTEQTKSQEDRALRRMVTDRRERQWFERYRWFVSSDGHLVVGGRDATTNSIIINKYTKANDIVFHADLHGSPFFILGNSGGREAPSDEIALELAQATVSFSRAWKDELGSADAFWVYGDQVKKSAPTGEYLPRGSFFIDGKKNLVKHVKVELSVGVTTSLPIENISTEEPVTVAVVCGPEKSVSKNTIARLKVVPGKEKSSDIAKRILQQLIVRVNDQRVKEETKKLSIDEIIRILPSGGYKVVSEK